MFLVSSLKIYLSNDIENPLLYNTHCIMNQSTTLRRSFRHSFLLFGRVSFSKYCLIEIIHDSSSVSKIHPTSISLIQRAIKTSTVTIPKSCTTLKYAKLAKNQQLHSPPWDVHCHIMLNTVQWFQHLRQVKGKSCILCLNSFFT